MTVFSLLSADRFIRPQHRFLASYRRTFWFQPISWTYYAEP
jgi:hypothetical protein